MVEEYFSKNTWYDEELRQREKHDHADQLENIRKLATFHFVKQDEQLGDGHAILQAKHLINENEPTLVIFGDCLYHGDKIIEKLSKHYDEHGNSIIAVQEIHPEETHQYGIVGHKEGHDFIVDTLIEKPSPGEAPSSNAIIGRYILSPKAWKHLEKLHSESGEARLIDALKTLKEEEDVHALLFDGTWLDTGTLEGLQKAGEHLKKHSKN